MPAIRRVFSQAIELSVWYKIFEDTQRDHYCRATASSLPSLNEN